MDMTSAPRAHRLRPPRWDRNRLLFEIDDGEQPISCSISQEALQYLSERRLTTPLEWMACFAKARTRVEKIALEKSRARAGSVYGLVAIWSGDVDDGPEDQDTAPIPAAD